jgi:hypothetical protein
MELPHHCAQSWAFNGSEPSGSVIGWLVSWCAPHFAIGFKGEADLFYYMI